MSILGITELKQLISEIKDGVDVIFVVEDNAVSKLGEMLQGKGGELPIKIKIKVDE